MREIIKKSWNAQNINKPGKIFMLFFWFVLSFSFVCFLFNLPSEFSPKLNPEQKTELAGKITSENSFSGSFAAKNDNLRKIFFYFTTNIKSRPKNSPRVNFSIFDENNQLIYSDDKKICHIRNKKFYELDLDHILKNSKGQKYKFEISAIKNLKNPDGFIALWKNANGQLIVALDYTPAKIAVLKNKFYLFLPSLLIILFIAFVATQKILNKTYLIFNNKQILFLIITPFLFINAIFYVFYVNHWAPIDEQSHFEVIKTISKKGTLPTLYSRDNIKKTREAFQPPLYYIVSSPLILFIKKSGIQAMILRIWGVVQYIILALIGFLIYQQIARKYKKLQNNLALILFILSAALIPALIVRTVCISNGTFSYIFIALQTLFLLKYLDSKNKSKKYLVILSIISGLSLLTRLTNVYTIPVIGFAILLKEKAKFMPIIKFAAIIIILLSPWLAWNYAHYKALTPNKLAMEDQKEQVNPTGRVFGFDFIKSRSLFMLDTVSIAEDYGLSQESAGWKIARGISYAIILSIILCALLVFKNIKKSFNPEKKEFILSIMLGFILMNILQQYAVVILDNWPVLLGRYLHGSLIAISVILTILLSSFLRNKLMFNLTCSALSIILVFFNAIYLLIVIQKF